jgi:hypothetical protein
MKNFKYTVVLTVALALVASSCKKSYLDVAPPSNVISTGQEAAAVKQDPTLLGARIAGLYATMYAAGTGGTGGADDFGQKGYDIYSDFLCSDMVLGGTTYGWYLNLIKYVDSQNNASNSVYAPWRYYYRVILGANTVIDFLGGSDVVLTDPKLLAYMGQAKAMRAYAYFYLAQFYAKGYGTGNERVLPLNLTSLDLNKPTSTTAQVYAQIIKDLTAAITDLTGYTRTDKSQINVDVAKGLLAYTYAARGTAADLAQVITLTDDVLVDFPLTTKSATCAVTTLPNGAGTVTNSDAGFNNVATPSWIWGIDLTIQSNLNLNSWWGQIDLFTYSYAWAADPKFIDLGLYNAMAVGHPDDVRIGQFVNNFKGYGGLVPVNKFFDPGRVLGGQRNVTTDYVYMRADEMLLLGAEARARTGDDAGARTQLKKLLSLRLTNITYVDALTSATVPSLLDEIYLQTRLEFWGEGKSYLAMKRLKRTNMIRGANHLFLAGQSFAFDDVRLTFPIPQVEILNNPNLNN